MEKIIPLILMVFAILLTSSQSYAGPLTPIVDDANYLRATAWELNNYASEVESEIRFLQAHGINPCHLKNEARGVRSTATALAQESNRVAKVAFDYGYHRPNHSHLY